MHCTDQADLDETAPEVVLEVLPWHRIGRSDLGARSVLLMPLAILP
jgi:hypothetical protein